MEIIRWLGLLFIPYLFVIRFYAKKKTRPRLLKGLIVGFFVCFVVWIGFFLKYNQI